MKYGKKLFKSFAILFVSLLLIALSGCTLLSTNNNVVTKTKTSVTTLSSSKSTSSKTITITKEEFVLLKGTVNETKGYVFTSSEAGPRTFIMGGTHGDETAGFMAALKLLELKDYRGTVMIIPRVNTFGCDNNIRYVEKTTKNYSYYDLNRNFPGKENGSTAERIAYQVTLKVKEFAPDYMVDLHESKHSYTYIDPNSGRQYLGNELIYGNMRSSLIASDIVEEYNKRFLASGDDEMVIDQSPPDGSFNYYFGKTFKNALVFTIETNRELLLNKRINQQLNLLKVIFEFIYSEYDNK